MVEFVFELHEFLFLPWDHLSWFEADIFYFQIITYSLINKQTPYYRRSFSDLKQR